MPIFSFGRFSYKLLYLIFLAVFSYLSFFIRYKIINIDEKRPFKYHQFFFFALHSFGELSCGIIELISIKKQTSETHKKSILVDEMDTTRISGGKTSLNVTFLKKEKMMKIRIKFWHILILGALKYLTGFFMVLQKIAEKSLSLDIIQIMRIIFTSLLCYFIFRTKYGRHHIFSIILILVGLTISSLPTIIIRSENIGMYYLLYKIIENIIFSILEVLEKNYMDFMYLSPYRMIFYEGCVTFVMQIATLTIANFIGCFSALADDTCKKTLVNFNTFFSDLNENPIVYLLLFLYILIQTGYNFCRVMVNKEYSPTHRTIVDSFSCFCMFISNIFIHYSKKGAYPDSTFIYPGIAGYIIVIAGSLIYHEIILLHCCGLAYNTRIEIDKRGKKEDNKIKQDEEIIENIKKSEIENLIPDEV